MTVQVIFSAVKVHVELKLLVSIASTYDWLTVGVFFEFGCFTKCVCHLLQGEVAYITIADGGDQHGGRGGARGRSRSFSPAPYKRSRRSPSYSPARRGSRSRSRSPFSS